MGARSPAFIFMPKNSAADITGSVAGHRRGSSFMAYYAHSVAGRPEAEWEPLARHLTEVAAVGNVSGRAIWRGWPGGCTIWANIPPTWGSSSSGTESSIQPFTAIRTG